MFSFHMRKPIASLLLLTIACGLMVFDTAAQKPPDDWARVKSLSKHAPVIVERKTGKRVHGILHLAADNELSIITRDNTLIAVPKDNVKKVYHAIPRSEKKGLNRGALFGMLAGLAAGLAVEAKYPSEGQEVNGFLPFLAGAGIGLLLGKRWAKGVNKGAAHLRSKIRRRPERKRGRDPARPEPNFHKPHHHRKLRT